MPGLVAQGMQAAGPAYALLVDAWGESFLAYGEIEMRFVGVVLAGEAVRASVDLGDHDATFDVENTTKGHRAVVGRATKRSNGR